MFVKLTVCLGVVVAFALARPSNDQIVFRDDEDDGNQLTSQILPSVNSSQRFIVHPKASLKLENGEYFQGDMALTPEQQKLYLTEDNGEDEDGSEPEGLISRTGIINTKFRWPKNANGNVIVPYKINDLSNFCEKKIDFLFIICFSLEILSISLSLSLSLSHFTLQRISKSQ